MLYLTRWVSPEHWDCSGRFFGSRGQRRVSYGARPGTENASVDWWRGKYSSGGEGIRGRACMMIGLYHHLQGRVAGYYRGLGIWYGRMVESVEPPPISRFVGSFRFPDGTSVSSVRRNRIESGKSRVSSMGTATNREWQTNNAKAGE